MATTKKVLLFTWVFIFVFTCSAQENPVYKAHLASAARQRALMDAGVKEEIATWFATLGYSPKTLRDLKREGIDVVGSLHDFFGMSEKVRTVISDCIAIGTVSRIVSDTSAGAPYHTLVCLSVERYLRNDYKLKATELEIGIESGLKGEGRVTISPDDARFFIGERVLVFLDAVSPLLRAKRSSLQRFAEFANQRIRFELSGLKAGKISLTGGNATAIDRTRPEVEVLRDILGTLRVVNKTIAKK